MTYEKLYFTLYIMQWVFIEKVNFFFVTVGILLPTLPRRPCLDDATGLAEEIV